MSTSAFINFFGNMQVMIMAQQENIDLTDANAVKAVFDEIDTAVESINLSLILKTKK